MEMSIGFKLSYTREMTRQQAQNAAEGEVTIERIRILSHRPDEEPQRVEWLEPFESRQPA